MEVHHVKHTAALDRVVPVDTLPGLFIPPVTNEPKEENAMIQSVTIDEKAGTMTVVSAINKNPQPSKGKAGNLMLASTGGFQPTGKTFKGKPVRISVMAIVPPDEAGDGE